MISVVMAYHNRIPQLRNTLDSYIHFYGHSANIEIVIIDDCPEDERELKDFIYNYKLDNKVGFEIFVTGHGIAGRCNNKFRNPSVLYNLAVAHANGDKIFITNPENLHMGNIFEHIENELEDGKYLVFGAKSGYNPPSFKAILNAEPSFIQADRDPYAPYGWYQNSVYNNRLLHFATAITKKDYTKIKGFDPEYDKGISLDDNDFICNVIANGLEVVNIDEPYVIHQAHMRQPYGFVKEAFEINMATFVRKWGARPEQVLPNMIADKNWWIEHCKK